MKMATEMEHCPNCGEYLGERWHGQLWKFGHLVTEPHICTAKTNACKISSPHMVPIEELRPALREAEEKAHKSLGSYKFMQFGYWAAIWVHLNRVGNFNLPNPFASYVTMARMKGGNIDAKTDTSKQAEEATPAEG